MKERVIAIAILVAILLLAGLGGYFFRGIAAKSDRSALTQLQESNGKLQSELNELRKLPGAVETPYGVYVPLVDQPGYSRYVSNNGVTFVFKSDYSNAGKSGQVTVTETRLSEESLPGIATIRINVGGELVQDITVYAKEAGESVETFLERNEIPQQVQLYSTDRTLDVNRYRSKTVAPSNPVNSYGIDTYQGDLGYRYIEFTNNRVLLAYLSYGSDPMIDDVSLEDLINSVSMLK